MKKLISTILVLTVLITAIGIIPITPATANAVITVDITLNRLGSGGTESITATVGELLPAKITPPTACACHGSGGGCLFAGYFDKLGQRMYSVNGNRAHNEIWGGTENTNFNAEWIDSNESYIAYNKQLRQQERSSVAVL